MIIVIFYSFHSPPLVAIGSQAAFASPKFIRYRRLSSN